LLIQFIKLGKPEAGARILSENYAEHVVIEYEAPEETWPALAARLDRVSVRKK